MRSRAGGPGESIVAEVRGGTPRRTSTQPAEQFAPGIRTSHPLAGATRPPDVAGGLALLRLLAATPLVIGVIGIVLLAVGMIAVGALLLVVGGATFATGRFLGSPVRIADTIGGRPADPVSEARLVNVAEELCLGLGLSLPELRILDDPAPNAITLGRRADSAVLICTSGLLELLDRMELEGAIAHELAHIKRGDLVRSGLAMQVLAPLALVGSGAAQRVRHLAGDDGESQADYRAVGITRYPPGLTAALEKLDAALSTRPAGLEPVTARLTAALWCAPLEESIPEAPRVGVLDVALRAAALREL